MNNVWGIGVVNRDSYGYVAAAATWCVEAFWIMILAKHWVQG